MRVHAAQRRCGNRHRRHGDRGRHVKTAFRIGEKKFEAVGFNMSYRNFPDAGSRIDIAYNILPNRYRPDEIVLHLHDFHVHG